jgi:hypothetical protein
MMNDYFRNKYFRDKFLIVLATGLWTLFVSHTSVAQLVITSPLNNQVVQRSQKDSAIISITGYTYCPYKKVDITLEPRSGTLAKASVHTVPESQLNSGFMHTQIKARTGWYRLQMTATRPDGQQDTISIPRVGVGEVFLVAGNSNAMGVPDLGALSASDNVVTFDTVNKILNGDIITVASDEPMRMPVFSRYTNTGFSYPTGETSWIWGELGDMIYKRFGTPVLFFNAGWAAANSINYRDAASGKDAFNHYVGKIWPYKQPYTNIHNTLQYYHSWLGVRAVLWSHGENDAYHLHMNKADYLNNMQYVIGRVREDFGFNVPWVIGLSTATKGEDKPYAPIIEAQTALGKLPGFNTWPGPDTDTIQIPRRGHGHFENIAGGVQGISLSARAWNRSLPDSFFKSVAPIQPKYAIHTGVVPASIFPGGSFTLPFVSTNAIPSLVQAELLNDRGMFVAIVGTGTSSPLKISIPSGVLNGSYRIRIVATKPILVGTASEVIDIHRKYNAVGYIRALSKKQVDDKIEFSWVMSANPGVTKITLQKSTDYFSYDDLEQFPASDNQEDSGVYAYTDTDTDDSKVSTYYRIRMDYDDGSVRYSGGLVIFREDAPPSFVIFPNPTPNQNFFLRSEIPGQAFTCSLFDMAGREHAVVTDENEIIGLTLVKPVYSVSSGVYILKIKTDSGTSTQRVVFR